MPLYELQLKAQLSNVDTLETSEDGFRWPVKVVCTRCRETHEKVVYVDSCEPKRGRGSSVGQLSLKCKNCGNAGSADIVDGSVSPYREADSGQFKSLVRLDFRGLEPLEFLPESGWVVKSICDSGTVFKDVDLSECEWTEFDVDGNCCLEVMEVETRVNRTK